MPPPAWAFNDVACAPALLTTKRDKTNEPALRVVGVQDPAIRELFGPGDTLVISGGANAGLQSGQRFFVRRVIPQVTAVRTDAAADDSHLGVGADSWCRHHGVHGPGVLHACEAIMFDDYLEPFVAPTVAARPLPGTTPQYENMGHIVTGHRRARRAQRQATS